MDSKTNRRTFIKSAATLSVGTIIYPAELNSAPNGYPGIFNESDILIDPTPLFEISPVMYMQFMEPLGNTEPSVEGSWNYHKNDWREDFVDCVKDLAPDLIRWGGIFNRYYKWKEGIGPAEKRPWMTNYQWGGKETNRVGTHEILDLSRRVGAETIFGVNFNSDGIESFKKTDLGENRYGTSDEAAEWVSYVNDPDHHLRKRNGRPDPFNVKYWQLGNESSYSGDRGFSKSGYLKALEEFIPKMKARDPSVKLIAWGDVPNTSKFNPIENDESNKPWAEEVLRNFGNNLDFVAYHQMGIYPRRKDTVLKSFDYLKNPARAWEELLEMASLAEYRIKFMADVIKGTGSGAGLAVTEGHISLSPYNTNTILRSWLSVAYHAKTFNAYLRHGDKIRICTGADFNGSRWTVNAVMMPQPAGQSFLLPIGHIMKWFNREKGSHGTRVDHSPNYLDISSTIKGKRLYLHVLNTSFNHPVATKINVKNKKIIDGLVYEMSPEDKMAHIDQTSPKLFEPEKKVWTENWTFPPASVSILILNLS